jgi:hypothetical protein
MSLIAQRRPLLIGAAVLASLLALGWFGLSRFGPGSSATVLQDAPPKEIDLSTTAYAFTWAQRAKGKQFERAAPALAMRIEPTDLYGWGDGGKARVLNVRGDPETLALDLLLPNADAFPQTSSNELCGESNEAFSECQAGRARLVLQRDESDSEHADLLLERKPLPDQGPLSWREFLTQEDKTNGRIEFLGWICGAGESKAEQALFGPPPRASAKARHEKCLAPTWQQKLAGPDKQRLLISCPSNAPCEMHFLFGNRLARIEAEELPTANTGELRARLFFAAWETLNRMHRNGLKPPAATAELAEATTQQAVCLGVSKEAFRWQDTLRGAGQKPQSASAERWKKRWASLSHSCLRAADIARRMGAVAPTEAEPVLLAVMQARIALGARDPDSPRNFDALFAMIKASGKSESATMLTALAMYLGYSADVIGTPGPELDARLAQVVQARWLLAQYGSDLHDVDRAQLVGYLVRQYAAIGRTEDEIATYQQAIADLEGRYGGNDLRLLEPLSGLSQALWRSGDAITSVRTADRARRLWLTQAAAIRAGNASAANAARWEEIGVDLVAAYRNYAFRQTEFHVTRPPIAEIISGLEQRLGADHPAVRKAQRYGHEVLARRKDEG